MSFCLRNQRNNDQIIVLTTRAWHHLLVMAEDHGWNPLGTVQPEWWQAVVVGLGVEAPDIPELSYAPALSRMVLVEDALNLADALDAAWLAYEPLDLRRRGRRQSWSNGGLDGKPGIGTVQAVTNFCREGAFWIEPV